MSIVQVAALFITALLAGALNSVAGGGSFLTFPTLLFMHFPSVAANATNTIALWPGSLASVSAYRSEFTTARRVLIPMCIISLIGGVLGAVVLAKTSDQTFSKLIPWLLLFATLIFTFSPRLTKYLRERNKQRAQAGKDTGPSTVTLIGSVFLQLLVASYGGFFGGGIGILMLALLGIMGMENIHSMNALKTLLATFINGAAVVIFVYLGKVLWPQAVIMIIGAVIGGYGGAFYARKVNPVLLRRFVIVIGILLTLYFFYQQYIKV